MRARFIYESLECLESLSFQRGSDPRQILNIGGLSFETLRPGAILQAKKWFGLTKKTGKLSGFSGSSIKIWKDNYLLVTGVTNDSKYIKTISWIRFNSETYNEMIDKRKEFENTGKIPFSIFKTNGFIKDITKQQFNNRLDIIERGFDEYS